MYSSLKEATALLKRDEWVKPHLGRYRKILTRFFSPPDLCSLQDGSLQALPKCPIRF